MTVVRINQIVCNNGVADVNGALWYVSEMDGWDSPEVRQQSIPRPGQHGELTLEGLYAGRVVRISGLTKCPSSTSFYQSKYYLQAQTNFLGRSRFIMRVLEDIDRRMEVIRAAQVRTTNIGINTFNWDLTLRADDPIKYSTTLKTEALNANVPEVLVNDGNMRTYPTFQLDAAGIPVITVGPLTWQATASISAGTVIDMKELTTLNGGSDHFHKVDLSSEWAWLEPGNNTVESSVPVTVKWRDGWL